ncbi:fibronectin type III domain-containing protein [Frondihabitans australicus]|uniref:Fibronectin type III domain protein n=1 Tax=Frondihabitans australicus TaxID=386892 RepID=A0A495IC56_9MICO|nr:fibronectin type III domain-containing protein [Frondihabitans australicus]RKR73583.1 fibronectin type III domain protein [Frondihabitans australicus]
MKRTTLVAAVAITAGALAAVGLSSAGVAQASAPVITKPNAIIQLAAANPYVAGAQSFADSGFTFSYADTTRGILATATPKGSFLQFNVAPPVGKPLVAGTYLYPGGDDTTLVPLADAAPHAPGDIMDVLDVASSPTDGTITRFDAVIEGVGEFRFGENESASAVIVGSRHIVFPESFVGSPALTSVETLHNTGTSKVALGTPVTSGQSHAAYRVSQSTCGASLAAGATCSLLIGFSPTTGGPADAALTIPVGTTTETVSLSGTAYLGTSSITVGGSDPVDKGVTTSAVAGKAAMYEAHGGEYSFEADDPSTGDEIANVVLEAPNYGTLPLGSRKTGYILDLNGYGVRATVHSLGCDTTGSEDVKAFTTDATGFATMADVTFSQTCDSDPHVQTGSVLWQYRSDTTAPAATTALTVSSTKATWKASTSSDSSYVVARLVEGDGRGATVTSGTPLTVSGASAALPALQANEQYTVALFDVDTSGNVSAVTEKTFGTAPTVVTAPGAPTALHAVAGPNGTATVTFTPPTSTGGLPITSYRLSSPYGGTPVTGTSTTLTIGGLKKGAKYWFVVIASNAAGSGAQPLASNTITAT